MCTVRSPHAVITRCILDSPKRAWARKESWHPPPRSAWSCRKASATPCASPSRPRRGRPGPRALRGPAPGGDRTEEVRVGQQILQSIGIRSFTPQVTACPGCGRTTSTFFQEMAEQIQSYLREQMPSWKGRYVGVEEMKLAVMGCVVNGPGESKHANIGISLPGTFEEPKAPVYVDGRLFTTLKGDKIVAEFIQILDEYVESHYAAREVLAAK